MSAAISNVRPKPDKVLTDMADYAMKYKISSTMFEVADRLEAVIWDAKKEKCKPHA